VQEKQSFIVNVIFLDIVRTVLLVYCVPLWDIL